MFQSRLFILNCDMAKPFSPKPPETQKHGIKCTLLYLLFQRNKAKKPSELSEYKHQNLKLKDYLNFQSYLGEKKKKRLCFLLPQNITQSWEGRRNSLSPTPGLFLCPVLRLDGCLNKQRLGRGLYLNAGTGYHTASSHSLPLIVSCIRRLSKHNLEPITFEC